MRGSQEHSSCAPLHHTSSGNTISSSSISSNTSSSSGSTSKSSRTIEMKAKCPPFTRPARLRATWPVPLSRDLCRGSLFWGTRRQQQQQGVSMIHLLRKTQTPNSPPRSSGSPYDPSGSASSPAVLDKHNTNTLLLLMLLLLLLVVMLLLLHAAAGYAAGAAACAPAAHAAAVAGATTTAGAGCLCRCWCSVLVLLLLLLLHAAA
ncbi:hypothetical protein ACSSS7_006816 [Eimeria intestinalis]